MGADSYSHSSRSIRAADAGYYTKSREEIFTSHKVPADMAVMGLGVRECFDSSVHPYSIPIIIALDITGSMGKIPHQLVQDGLPKMISLLHEKGIMDAAVCFVAVGDHKSDRGILQVGQFESGDEKLDHWLTSVWLEGNGGGNGGESYFLPWYFAAKHTHTHAWEKRNQKGFLFTIGDERCHDTISAEQMHSLTGGSYEGTLTSKEILEQAKEKWNVFHLNLSNSTQRVPGEMREESVQLHWKSILGDDAIYVKDFHDIPTVIAEKIVSYLVKPSHKVTEETSIEVKEEKKDDKQDIIL